MKTLLIITATAIITALLMVACATAPAIDQQILTADQAVTVVVTGTDTALLDHAITPEQAKSVSTIAHQINPLLDSAQAAFTAKDIAGASNTLTLVNSLLASLHAYLVAAPVPAK